MRELLNQSDFEYLKGQGFDHVRLFVDPVIYGCQEGQYTVNANSLGMQATVETIQEARAAGLKVILLCYPGGISKKQWTLDYGNSAFEYPGPWRQELVYYPGGVPSENPVSPIPLVQFWKTFVQALDGANIGAGWLNDVAFEIMNESHEDFTVERLILPNGTTGSQARMLQEASGRNWREVVRRCINGIQSVDSDARVIASTYQSTLPDYVAIDESDPQDSVFPVGFDTYNSSEVIKPVNVAYSVHLYEPFRYTHWQYKDNDPVDPTYFRGRDYFGDLDSIHDDYDDDHGTSTGMNGSPIPVPPDMTQKKPFESAVEVAVNRMYLWRMGQGYPVVLVDEFGVKRRQNASLWDPNDGNGPEAIPAELPATLLLRARWTFDCRKAVENRGLRWSVFEYIGQFGIMNGELNNRSKFHFNERPINGSHGIILPVMSQSLFGNTRPE